jgi:uncharacterized metal-binding protein
MPDLPKKKVGIVACSGEEMAEGTVTRRAALQVLEKMRPEDTVTICLPLFLAGGEGDRAFAKFYPTIAIDGCDKRCAARGTEMYSGKPAASIIVTELVSVHGLEKVEGKRHLNEAGMGAVEVTARRITSLVDELLEKRWDRRAGDFAEMQDAPAENSDENGKEATCSCGSGIPVQKVQIDGQEITLLALPFIFEQFRQAGKSPAEGIAGELLETVRVYNPLPDGMEGQYRSALLREYAVFCTKEPQ